MSAVVDFRDHAVREDDERHHAPFEKLSKSQCWMVVGYGEDATPLGCGRKRAENSHFCEKHKLAAAKRC